MVNRTFEEDLQNFSQILRDHVSAIRQRTQTQRSNAWAAYHTLASVDRKGLPPAVATKIEDAMKILEIE